MIKFKDLLTESEINYEQNKDLYPIIKKMGKFQGSRLLENIQSEMNLTEMLNMSLNHSQLAKQLTNTSDIIKIEYDESLKGNDGPVTIYFKPGTDIIKINKTLDAFGWFPSYITTFKKGHKFSEFDITDSNIKVMPFRIRYEPKFDTPISIDYLDYVYHITTDIAYNKIKLLGLTPKLQSKLANHPGRIYLLTSDDVDTIDETALALITTFKNKDRVKNIMVLKIDSKYLQSHKFYEDPNFFIDEAIWTQQNIPPAAISVGRIISYSDLT